MRNSKALKPHQKQAARYSSPRVCGNANLLRCKDTQSKIQPPRPGPELEKLWIPTPETCTDSSKLTPLQRRIYEQLLEFKKLEKKSPKTNLNDQKSFLQQFDWSKSIVHGEQRKLVEELLVEFSDIFARHRFDVGYNTEYKVKLTPEHDPPVYMQSPLQ